MFGGCSPLTRESLTNLKLESTLIGMTDEVLGFDPVARRSLPIVVKSLELF